MSTPATPHEFSANELLPVGIDLGTTLSAIATMSSSGRTMVLADEFGEILTPSVVSFRSAEITVGREAIKEVGYNVDGIADNAKRDIGKPLYHRPILGKAMPPEVIQACVLRHLKKIIDGQITDKYAAVITVPAFFDERRRRSTENAGRMAGLEVLDIINEPTAAALAFGEQLGFLDEDCTVQETIRVLVFDLGGGTFDVTIIELRPDGFFTIATDGDVQLGGVDWDARLADYVAQKFEAEHRIDPRQNPAAWAKILQSCEDAKHTLSVRNQVTVPVEYSGHTEDVQVTREQFNAITSDLLERTAHTSEEVRLESGLSWDQIDRVLLVGGSTRMPMVMDRLVELTGKTADQSVNPDEAVARGAAIYAAFLLSKAGHRRAPMRKLRIVDVNSHSLGVEGVDVSTGRKQNSIVIPRNTPLPASIVQPYVTRTANQPSIVLKVLEGETADPENCITIGRAVLRDLPDGLPSGHPLEVTFTYANNGRLTAMIEVPGTDRQLQMELQRGETLTDQHVEAWAEVLTAAEGFDSFDEMLSKVLGIEETAE